MENNEWGIVRVAGQKGTKPHYEIFKGSEKIGEETIEGRRDITLARERATKRAEQAGAPTNWQRNGGVWIAHEAPAPAETAAAPRPASESLADIAEKILGEGATGKAQKKVRKSNKAVLPIDGHHTEGESSLHP